MTATDRIERGMIEENRPVEDILEDDARRAIVTIFRLLTRYPFAFYEDGAEPPDQPEK